MVAHYFQHLGIFEASEIEAIAKLFTVKKLKKQESFVREGEYCKAIALIQSGIFRSYYTSENADEHTYCFRFPNDLMASYTSFITGEPSREHMQAITDATIFVASQEKIAALAAGNYKWMFLLKTIAEQEYVALEKRFFQLQRDKAQDRYAALLRDQPNYVQDIPLQYLASYLGITQRHLSRIRAELTF